jgi:hypothetical protein
VQRYVLFLVSQQFFERNFKKNICVETSSLTIKHLEGFIILNFFVET